ncbi:MAG: hypothetical protein J3K34DRAFT_461605 [Monoraphidium minutum]|nr:MAG: hypothetical protein J3K34DRAFT_461605 [Monoraphidium minutum]
MVGSRLAFHWLNADYADCEALVMLHDGIQDPGVVAVRLPAHRIVLTAASPYFAALFERWARRHHHHAPGAACDATSGAAAAAAAPRPPPAPCVLHVTSRADVDAAVALLRCCYTDTFEDVARGGPGALLLPAGGSAGAGGGGGGETKPSGGGGGCWQQLAVRTLVLADRLDCGRVAEVCISALSGRLFAHQMAWDCAMAALWLLPEPLAHQEVVAPLTHMAHVRVVQEFGELEAALADPGRAARLQQLPAEALALLLLSPELAAWGEGAALAAFDTWLAGPVGAATAADQLAAIGRAVRLPLLPGPLLAAAALAMPGAAFAAWPLAEMARYYRATLDERYEMTRALLEAGGDVPWSAVRRPRAAPEALTAACATVHLSQLRGLHEQQQGAAGGAGAAASAEGAHAGDGGGGTHWATPPAALELGGASFGGYTWKVALMCCDEPPADSQGEGEQAPDGGGAGEGGAPAWRLGLRVSAAPLLCGHRGGAAAAAAEADGSLSEHLMSIGAAKAAAAAARHVRLDDLLPEAQAHLEHAVSGCKRRGPAPQAGAHAPPPPAAAAATATAALGVVAGVCVEVAERPDLLGPPGTGGPPFAPLLLSESCASAGDGGRTWCMRAGLAAGGGGGACGLCRRGIARDALAAAGGGDAAATLFAGWQPARWSALAPVGQLHWRCRLRVLTDY